MKHALLLTPLLCSALPAQDDAPPARALMLELTATPRLAGTPGSYRAVEFVSKVLTEAGWQVEVDSREVLISLPRRLELSLYEDGAKTVPFHERFERFDSDAIPPGDLPPFNAWTASGELRAEVIDAGWGLPADFARLAAARIDVTGKVALCRYGRSYRGDKVAQAEAAGCAAVLLFSPAADDGAGRGPTWPQGPWKPSHEAQRGSVGPMTTGPGDPLTPGFPAPPVGKADPINPVRLQEATARLPHILVMPIGVQEAESLLSRLGTRRVRDADGDVKNVRLGPGPVTVALTIDAPRERRPIHNVIARLPGKRRGFVMAGNHRDAWVRGANDAGGGTVSLMRAAQELGARHRAGWTPEYGIALGFWDAEETGLVGSTEWGEAHAGELRERCVAYINADALVSGLTLRASGSPGLEGVLARALAQVAETSAPGADAPLAGRTLLDQWHGSAGDLPRFNLPGSGSDFTVFLHHLGLPVIDLGFSGNSGGQYHTAFDDFAMVERYLDPGWVGHETAGQLVATLLAEIADLGPLAFDDAWAASELERHAEEAVEWLGTERSHRLGIAFATLGRAISLSWTEWRRTHKFMEHSELGPFGAWPTFLDSLDLEENKDAREAAYKEQRPPFYGNLLRTQGLDGRPWFKNELWAPDPANGYGTQKFPRLRAAADAGDEAALEQAFSELLERIDALRREWDARAEAARAARRR
jgi:N-acetylated-alpha-linked acidic dipeptidase